MYIQDHRLPALFTCFLEAYTFILHSLLTKFSCCVSVDGPAILQKLFARLILLFLIFPPLPIQPRSPLSLQNEVFSIFQSFYSLLLSFYLPLLQI